MLENDGPVPATITEAKIALRQPVFLDAIPGNAIPPGEARLIRGEMTDENLATILGEFV